MSPDNFKAPFTAAEGWGTLAQKVADGQQSASIELRYGKLHLKQLALDSVPGTQASKPVVTLDGRNIDTQFQRDGARTIIRFPEGIDIAAGQTLQVQHV